MARNQGQDVSDVSPSFFKVMYGENYAKVLYIPPKFAPVITKLNGRKTYLEDSLGAKWEVTVSEVDGFLAFEQGWNDFFVGHGVEYGDFLIFNYMETYFDVEIYNKSLVPRGEFPNSSQTKKKTQIDRECSSPLNDRMKPTKRLMKRQNSRKRIMESDEADSDGESPSLYCHSKDRSQSKGNNVEGDVCEKTPEFKRQNVEIDVGGKENPSSSCSEIQPKRDFVEESLFGFAWKGDKNTDNEARTAVLDLSEVELWGGCCLNQSGGIKASADRNGFGDKDQGASYHGVRTDETSDCASEVTAKVGPAAEIFQNKWKSVAPNTPKDTYHNLSGDHPRKPESTDTASGPVSAEKKAHMSPADHQEHDYNKRVPAAVSGPSIKKERVEIYALPINLTKNKPTAQEKALIATKMEPKVEPYWAPEPLRAVATNRFFLELPLELPCESLQRKKVAERVVLLQDPCKRLWPVSYNTTKKILSQGWEDFLNGNGVQLGDECILSFKGNFVYGVSVVKKQRVT